MHTKQLIRSGTAREEAGKALILVHGRGASAEDILTLTQYLHLSGFALIAPQATDRTWYPYSFMAPPAANEPWLSSAVNVLKEIVADLTAAGISHEQIYLLGFSQGACLTLEFAARNALRYGGIAAFTGGLIGDKIYPDNYSGDFAGTPIFIGTSDPDPHVPVQRVNDSEKILKGMGAEVTKKIYANMGHTITEEELALANRLIFERAE